MGARTADRLEALATEIDPSGERVAAVPFDILDDAGRERLVDTTVDRFGRLDGLVQVAARQGIIGPFLEMGAEGYRESYEGNLVAPLQLARHAAARMQELGGGSLVLVGSQSARVPTGPTIVYGASKGALVPAMYYMAEELGPLGIRVNVIEPTWTWGHRVREVVRSSAEERGFDEATIVEEIVGRWPLRKMPENADVAEVVVFLLSDRSRMITGQLFRVNAGQFMG